jgi:uncharacterized protein (TIGR02266 family)
MQGSLVVRMRFPRLEDFRSRYARDISRGGVFIQTQQPKPVGSSVVLVLELATGDESVALSGEVVTSLAPQDASAQGLAPGMGIRFLDLEGAKRRAIEDLLARGLPSAASPAAAAPAPAAPPAPRNTAKRPVAEPDIAQLQREARTLIATLEAQDLYQVLGLGRDATTGEVRRAYLKLTRKYHPDNYFRRIPRELADLLDDIYDRLTQAYETLADRDTRIAYDLSIGHLGGNRDGVGAADMERFAAEEKRRKESPGRVSRGEQLCAQAMQDLAAGQQAKAVANLKLALAFDPENAQIKGKLQELTRKR